MNQNDQIIYETARRNGFNPEAAKLIVAQARFESDDYKSSVFRNNLNTSGMKFIGQPLAMRGTLAPFSERSASCRAGNVCYNSDYYAKFKSVADSASDKINRLYNISIRGVTPDDLKNVKTPEEFARLLKRRGYYGAPESQYANGLRAKLKLVDVDESFVGKKAASNNYFVYGLILIVAGISAYYAYKRLNK